MTKRNGSGCVFLGADAAIFLLLAAMFALFAVMFMVAKAEQERWDKFSISHNCRVVQKVIGSTHTGYGVGVTTNGKVGAVITTTSTPAKTGWLCDDGVTYWR